MLNQGNGAAAGCFWRNVTNRKPRCAAGKPAVGQQGADFVQTFGFQVRRRVQHFLHARSAARAFVTNHHHFTGRYLVGQDGFYGIILALADVGSAFEYLV